MHDPSGLMAEIGPDVIADYLLCRDRCAVQRDADLQACEDAYNQGVQRECNEIAHPPTRAACIRRHESIREGCEGRARGDYNDCIWGCIIDAIVEMWNRIVATARD